jgi:tight adherence protein B
VDILTLATITLAFAAGLMLTVSASRFILADRGTIKQRLQALATYSASAEQSQQPVAIRTERTRDALQGGWAAKTALQLERAGLQLRVSEYMLIRFLAGVFGFLLVALISGGHPVGLIVGAIVAVGGFMAPAFIVLTLKARRVHRINEQLDQMVSMISNSLKAGFGLLQSLDQAAQQLSPPLSSELLRVIHETDVGATLEEALTGLAERVESYDLDMTVTAILVQRTVGGNLAEVLDNVGHTIRERVRIQGEINTLTAQKKLSGAVIGLMPVVLVLLFFAIDPDYMSTLFTHSAGRIMLVIGVVLDLLGLMAIRRILAVDI